MSKGRAWILLGAVAALVLVPASATAVPKAGKSANNEDLIRYTGPKRIKIEKRMKYFLVCTADCDVTVSSTLVVPGPDVGPLVDQKPFEAGTRIQALVIVKSKAGRRFLRDNADSSRIKSKVSATDIATGDTDTDKRSFKFKT